MGALLSKRDGGVPATLQLLLPETGETAVPNEHAISRYAAGLPCSHVTGGGGRVLVTLVLPFLICIRLYAVALR